MKRLLFFASIVVGIVGARAVSAHEAYVLPRAVFWSGMMQPLSAHAFAALKDPHNVLVTLGIFVFVAVLYTLNFFFRKSAPGIKLHAFLEGFAHIGPHLVRYTIAIALLFSALSNSFLGPELTLASFPHPQFVRVVLFAASILFAAGFLTELASLLCVSVFVWGFFVFGAYMLTYLNYLGEFVVLVLFGMRVFSIDRFVFGPLHRFAYFKKYETAIVRIFYGLALSYAAVNVKLLHPALTVQVVTDWHLTKFHWLFPSDPLLVVLGAGLGELAIGLFIAFGFEMRLTVLISLFYITLSLLYFRELVWPHLLLYGISLNLLIQPETFTLDRLLFKQNKKRNIIKT